MKRPELLMPAGSLEKLKIAVLYGADAVYIGTPDLSLRTRSEFSADEVIEGIRFAHEHGRRVYLTLNLVAHNRDLEKLPRFMDTFREIQPDGVIVADPAVFRYLRQNMPDLELHISTQASVSSWAGVAFWRDMGAKLCVLAREVSFEEMKEIREKVPDIRLEAFIHGSMCMAYSGRCLMANFMTERGANQGSCANNCRWNYKVHLELPGGVSQFVTVDPYEEEGPQFLLEEKLRPGEFYPIEEDAHGSYLMNSRDLCLMPVLDQYLSLGIDSLKVEGRNKSLYYLAVVTRAYRAAIDAWIEDPDHWKPNPYMVEIETVPSRGYTLAFHAGRLSHHAHNYTFNRSLAGWEFAGIVSEWDGDELIIDVKNRLLSGDVLEFLPAGSLDAIRLRTYSYIMAEDGSEHSEVHAGQKPRIRIPLSAFDQDDPEWIRAQLTPLTAIRKERVLTCDEVLQVKANRLTHQAEYGKVDSERADEARAKAPDANAAVPRHQGEKVIKDCCGRGCNGCIIFREDPRYEKARQRLGGKKLGQRLSKTEALSSLEKPVDQSL